MSDFLERRDSVLVIGAGRSGLATAEVLHARGVSVVVYDDKPQEALAAERQSLMRVGVPLIGPPELPAAIAAAKGAVVSPGVPPTNAAVLAAVRAGISVDSEIEVAYTLSKAPIIAVTGSKGKSTTTALIGHLLAAAGKRNRVGGNIGNPLIRETAEATSDEWIVAEVSSFQLEGIRTFAPDISVLLNISPDHLDRYHSMHEYAEAKYRIFANQKPKDVFIGNADDPYCAALRDGRGRTVPCQTLWYGTDPSDAKLNALLKDDSLVLRIRGRERAIAAIADLRLKGKHNAGNAMAAVLASLAAGAAVESLSVNLATFEPLPHRLAVVRTDDSITWVDDSKATNPDAAIKAMESFGEPLILIAGGKSKRTDFSHFAAQASKRAKIVVLIGESAAEMGDLIDGPPVVIAPTLEKAVNAAANVAVPGDVVLLSPACASFDMFDNAEQRGRAFADLVRARTSSGLAAS
ncbi:MAG: UDP-N-acetylmuramoyl-L-alanine--D-glutamate ligase [Candidatus Eremiobacter antarcticus]|nr:UDP-N-acetylmuramoyl-L-alanine--D-glutamate ligase [Candidatus Eremiobacteraeota bacterium]MBC5808351.1 UDP-N-acetylmuramoyl-L-alanine--D-glutamate ligase [Candidatus Eremiobacteraeota bacterium]PZR63719.1 MAG: UDP-N-acetylmuramoyl-L-alanine--D-glutamate ligase [Candidatus Eremiobacter sp. RRmetagenome_bin22]